MKIYLAGKITRSGWREAVLTPGTMDKARPWVMDKEWPIIPNAVLGQHDYVGPYFIPTEDPNVNHDPGFHGPDSHGVDAQGTRDDFDYDNHGYSEQYQQRDVVRLCLRAVHTADAVFAWIDRCDLYGTLIELGYAAAHRKPILIGCPSMERDLWFAYELGTHYQHAESPRTALAALLARLRPQEQITSAIKIDGYVYLLESGGVYKIGRAKVVDNRIKQIQPKLPHPVELLHTIPCENMAHAEASLHAKYKDFRLNGEWFNLPAQAVAEIRAIPQWRLPARVKVTK